MSRSTARHLVCERDVGLFSLIQQVIAHIPWTDRSGRIPIALFGRRCCYWVPSGHRDRSSVWEYYFQSIDPRHPAESVPEAVRLALEQRFPDPRDVGVRLDDATWASCHYGDHPRLRGVAMPIPYGWKDPAPALRARAHRIIRASVRPRAYLAREVEAFWRDQMAGRRIVGVHIRGTDAVSREERRAHRQGSLVLDRYRRAVERVLAEDPEAGVFVATDDQRSLDFMTDAFGSRVIACESHRHLHGPAAGRGPSGNLMPAFVAADRHAAARNGEEAVMECLLLARCGLLVHNGSSLARTALLLNPELPHRNTHPPRRIAAHLRTFSIGKMKRAAARTWRQTKPGPPDALIDV